MVRLTSSLAVLVVLVGVGQVRGVVFPDPPLFGEPIRVPGDLLPTEQIGGYSLNPDGSFMVYQHGSGFTIHEAEWDGIEWITLGNPTIGSDDWTWESTPSLYSATDGQLWLYYTAGHGSSPSEIYRSRRLEDGTWDTGEKILGAVNSTLDNPSAPMFDGENLYFRVGLSDSVCDLWVSPYDSGLKTFGIPQLLPATINDGSYNNRPQMIGDTLLFSSDRDGTHDIWTSTLDGLGDWEAPLKLAIGGGHDDEGPWYSAARETLYFTRDGLAYQSQVVPEPSTIILLLTGAVGFLACVWRRKRVV